MSHGGEREEAMCRWLAYSGSPVNLEDLLYKPENSLVVHGGHEDLRPFSPQGSHAVG